MSCQVLFSRKNLGRGKKNLLFSSSFWQISKIKMILPGTEIGCLLSKCYKSKRERANTHTHKSTNLYTIPSLTVFKLGSLHKQKHKAFFRVPKHKPGDCRQNYRTGLQVSPAERVTWHSIIKSEEIV